MPRMHSSVMWESDETLTIDDLKRKRPYHHDDLLKRLCYDTEISCRFMANSDVPIWYHEVQYLEYSSSAAESESSTNISDTIPPA